MAGDQRIELALVVRELAVQIEGRLAQSDADFLHLGGIDLVSFDEIEQRGVHALDRGRGRPQTQRDLRELPAFPEIGGDRLRAAAIRVDIVKPAVARSEKFARGEKLLLGEQRRQQARERAAALVELHRRRSPRGEGARRLAAGKSERLSHGFGVEPAQAPYRRGGAEWAEHAGAVPAVAAEGRVIEADPNPRRDFASGGGRDNEVAPRQAIALGDCQGGRHHFRRHMRQRRAVHVAHRNRGDEIAVEKGRAGKRQRLAADDAALVRLRQARCERGDLLRLLAAVAGDRAGQSVEQEILAVIADALGNIVILQQCRKAGQHFGHVCGHTRLPCNSRNTAPRRKRPHAW